LEKDKYNEIQDPKIKENKKKRKNSNKNEERNRISEFRI